MSLNCRVIETIFCEEQQNVAAKKHDKLVEKQTKNANKDSGSVMGNVAPNNAQKLALLDPASSSLSCNPKRSRISFSLITTYEKKHIVASQSQQSKKTATKSGPAGDSTLPSLDDSEQSETLDKLTREANQRILQQYDSCYCCW
jgi:hypothetical protein